MRYFAYISLWEQRRHPSTRKPPDLWQCVEIDDSEVLHLRVKRCDETEPGLGPAVCLALVEGLLRDLILQDLGWLLVLEYLVLSPRQIAFEEILPKRETDKELLPGKERLVEGFTESLLGRLEDSL